MNPSRLIFIALSLTTVLLVVGGSTISVRAVGDSDDGDDSLYKHLSVFTEVLGLVKRAYVEETENAHLMNGAVEGTVDALDPFSLYVPPERVETFLAQREIGMQRSGLMILKERGVAYVVSIVEGSPAAGADLERGDVVSVLQGRPTRTMPLLEIQSILAGDIGEEIKIERIRLGQTETIRFELAEFAPPGITLETRDGAPVLRVSSFHSGLAEDARTILESVVSGSEIEDLKVRDRLLVDLRGVAGGDEASAYAMASLFTSGELGKLLDRKSQVEVFQSEDEPIWGGDRVVVLIDRGTQGAAEILATVLHQNLEAALIGERSFGHSGRQNLVELSTGGRLQITDAFFTGPDGKAINEGLVPDVFVRSYSDPDEGDPADPVLERGVEVLLDEKEPELKKAA